MSDLGAPELIPPGVNDARSRAFVRALGDTLATFRTGALLVQDPLTVDARLLPGMTIERGMSEFVSPGLREVHVRNLLAAAPELHALAGTVAGARRALSAIGVTVEWTQWFQAAPKRHHDTHVVVAFINDHLIDGETALLSAATQGAVLRLIEATQRWSQDIDFKLGLAFRAAAGAVGAMQSVAALMPSMSAAVPMPAARAALAGAFRTIQFVQVAMEAAA